MGCHDICFHWEIRKIIFELSSLSLLSAALISSVTRLMHNRIMTPIIQEYLTLTSPWVTIILSYIGFEQLGPDFFDTCMYCQFVINAKKGICVCFFVTCFSHYKMLLVRCLDSCIEIVCIAVWDMIKWNKVHFLEDLQYNKTVGLTSQFITRKKELYHVYLPIREGHSTIKNGPKHLNQLY